MVTQSLASHELEIGMFCDSRLSSLNNLIRNRKVNVRAIMYGNGIQKYPLSPIFPAGYGVTTDGTTVYINASTCNYNYRPLNPPVVFDLPNKP